ncbi:hypothetical protein SKAU_G00190190 [Synaphobranchus kaupii]|uniref:Uncharacterized protein n=1 Tax=Synaphobranchus kaupii TaxID=118154 RepID=A0A9Q1FDV0_SYNKA|nr:hypothetical protein SKAU_G00190190 [Synaphobranchus kaupii]
MRMYARVINRKEREECKQRKECDRRRKCERELMITKRETTPSLQHEQDTGNMKTRHETREQVWQPEGTEPRRGDRRKICQADVERWHAHIRNSGDVTTSTRKYTTPEENTRQVSCSESPG